MLFRELNTQFMQNISDISLESGEKGAITIDNNKSEFLVILEQVVKALSMEFILTFVQFRLNWSEWLNI